MVVPLSDVEAGAAVSTSALTFAAAVEDRIVLRITTVTETAASIRARTRSQHRRRVGFRRRRAPLASVPACRHLHLLNTEDMEVTEVEVTAGIRATTRLARPLLMVASTIVRLPAETSTVEIAGNMTAAEAVIAGAVATGRQLGYVQVRSSLKLVVQWALLTEAY